MATQIRALQDRSGSAAPAAAPRTPLRRERFRRALAAATAAALLPLAAARAAAQDALVIAPADLQPAVAEWKAWRESQGLEVAVRAPTDDLAALVRDVHKESGGKLRFVLLLGDADRLPPARVPIVAIAQWERSDTHIATDAPFADVEGDGVPDLAIGRIPADSAAEAKSLLGRSKTYETNTDFGEWRRRLNVIAGVGGFGLLQDAAIENMTKQFLTKGVPPSVVITGTYGNPLSAWCPPPKEFAATTLERINEGSLVLAYIGHGAWNQLDRVQQGTEKYPILGPPQVPLIDVRHGAPLLVFVACSTGRFDGAEDCLAEEVLRRPHGPVGVIASSRVSTPYGNGILSKEMLAALWDERATTTGEVLLSIRKRLVDARADDPERKQIEGFAQSFYNPDPEQRAADRREHVALYNLLGDPCVRLARPADLPLEARSTAVAGTALEVSGRAPAAGRLLVEVVRRRDTVVPFGPRKTAEDFRATYRAANSLLVGSAEAQVRKGPFRLTVDLPADAKAGPCYVRAYLESAETGAAGGRFLELVAPPAKAPGDGGPAPRDGR